jgi:hypothetical protein
VTPENFFVLFRPFFGGTGFVLALVGGVVAYLPSSWLEALGLLGFRTYQRGEFALCFWVGIAIVLAVQFFDKRSILQRELQRLDQRREAAASKRELRGQLQRLTADEKAMVVRFIDPPRTWIEIAEYDRTWLGLKKQRILVETHRQIGQDGLGRSTLSMCPKIRALLIANPQILSDATPPSVVS